MTSSLRVANEEGSWVWTHEEAETQVDQLAESACGVTAVSHSVIGTKSFIRCR